MNFSAILDKAISRGVSDVHFQSGRPPLLRLKGIVVSGGEEACVTNEEIVAWLKALGLIYHTPVLSAAITWRRDIRCRLHVSQEAAGLHAVVRILYPLEMIGADQDDALFEQLASLSDGLVLVTGPTGCGKTTTLWQILRYANKARPCHIITLEDPIEYVLSGDKALISSREYGVHFHSFADGVKQALRQDLDILLIGEMRDTETMDAALTAAETGHLVFATLHTRSAVQAVSRLVGAYDAGKQGDVRYRLSLVLQGIIAQEKVCEQEDVCIYREILLQTPAVSQLIRSGKEHQLETILQTSAHLGMRTMVQAKSRKRKP